jgi:hypothetical protein
MKLFRKLYSHTSYLLLRIIELFLAVNHLNWLVLLHNMHSGTSEISLPTAFCSDLYVVMMIPSVSQSSVTHLVMYPKG